MIERAHQRHKCSMFRSTVANFAGKFAAYYRARHGSHKSEASSDAAAAPEAQEMQIESAPRPVNKKRKSSDDVKPRAKKTKNQLNNKMKEAKEEANGLLKWPPAAAASKVDCGESPSDDEFEQYRPTKNIKSNSISKAAPKKDNAKKPKSRPYCEITYAPLTGTNAADESSLPGPGWSLGCLQNAKKPCSLWISPQRKIPFQRSKKAREFETIRRKYNGDEYKAWEDFRSLHYKTKDPTCSVINPRQYDSFDRVNKYFYHDKLSETGWERITHNEATNNRNHWLSPEFNIEFRFPSAAMDFEKLRQVCDGDEEKAWNMYLARFAGEKVCASVDGGACGLEKAREKFGNGMLKVRVIASAFVKDKRKFSDDV